MTCRTSSPDPYEPAWRLLHRWSSWAIGPNYQQRLCLRCRKVQRKAI